MSKLKTYQFQLEQVQTRLRENPDDEKLRKLEEKLHNLIKLTIRLKGSTDAGVTIDAVETHPYQESSKPSKGKLEYAPGARCEARRGTKWYEAVIQSISSDEQTYTVIFASTAETLHCLAADIRPYNAETAQRKPLLASTAQASSTIAQAKDNRRKGDGGSSLKPPERRKKPSKEEHIKKKEEEHKVKQESWKKFSQKFGLGKKPA